MASVRPALAAHGATSLFVLLWSSGAIFAELGLRHASAFAFLIARFALASLVLLVLSLARRRWLPPRGARRATLATGVLLTGGYSILYLLALALTGLSLVVYRSVAGGAAPAAGTACALGALLAITAGALLQKRVRAASIDVLPLQNALGLALCALIAPFEPISFEASWAFALPLAWLGIVISVFAQLLFYRLMQRGDLVNVTSLFYLVPVVTAPMDAAWLGNRLAPLEIAGMIAILAGLALAFRRAARD